MSGIKFKKYSTSETKIRTPSGYAKPRFGVKFFNRKVNWAANKIFVKKKFEKKSAELHYPKLTLSQTNLCLYVGILTCFVAQNHSIRFIVELDGAI